MPSYKCSVCSLTTTNKYNIEKHMTLKKCKEKTPTILIVESEKLYTCPGCQKEYATNSGLTYHKKKCEEIKEMKKPVNMLTTVQQQTGDNEQIRFLINIINQKDKEIKEVREKVKEIKEVREEVKEIKKAQQKTDTKVNIIANYLSTWYQPYIHNDFFEKFHKAIESGISDKSQVFPNLINYIYSHPENNSICHKNKRTSIVTVHEDSQWINKTSEIVYPKVAELYEIYINTLKTELPYETKTQIKNKKLQLEFEQNNRNNIKYKKSITKKIEADFQNRSKLCDTSHNGEENDNAIILQNSLFILKQEAKSFEEAYVIFNNKTINIIKDDEHVITDDEQDSDPDYELEEDNFDSYYDENGNFKGSISEQNKYIKMRRQILNKRRSDNFFIKSHLVV